MGWEEALGLTGLAFWVGADTSAFLQIMVSQPLVAGWLAGLVMGEPTLGLAMGTLLQMVWGRALPMGAATFPLAGPAAVSAGALAALAGAERTYPLASLAVPDAATLAVVLLAAIAVAEVGRGLVVRLRRGRRGLFRRAEEGAQAARSAPLVRASLLGVLQSGALGVGLSAGGIALGLLALPVARALPPADGRWVALCVLGLGLGQTVSLVQRNRWGWVWLAALAAVALLAGSLG